jgi:SNF2 family DNA or RNA helicase
MTEPLPPRFKYRTEPRGKQREVIESTWDRHALAYLCRPGTGKTKIGLDQAAMNFLAGRIDALLVVCPDGVDRQWLEEGVPKHCAVPAVCCNYYSAMRKRAYEQLERQVLATPPLDTIFILTMSFDALQTPRGKRLIALLQTVKRYMCIDDESHRTSNPKSDIYKALKPVMRMARVRRIGTGTLIRQNPFSAWGQFELMGDAMLGFSSLAAFKSTYAAMLAPTNPLVQHIMKNLAAKGRARRDKDGNPVYPKIIAKDEEDRPIYRNLGDLRKRIERYATFLTLEDVNGAEPVVNETSRYVKLNSEQQVLYDELIRWGVAQAPGGQLTTEGALALAIRLSQVVGGFAPSDDNPQAQAIIPADANPKVQELLQVALECEGEKLVIWCRFSAEIDMVVDTLTKVCGSEAVTQYHGRMTGKEKDTSKLRFIHDSACRFFVGQQKAGGTGLDGLQGVASYMVFYSNDYSYLERLQAISRLARTDGANTVQVYDLMAQHTIDEDVVRCLRSAEDVSDVVLRSAIGHVWEH